MEGDTSLVNDVPSSSFFKNKICTLYEKKY
jgi:hypothetical protein